MDLGIDPKVMSSSINVAMAQRLVRKLCQTCKKQVPLKPENKTVIDRVAAGLRDKSVLPTDASFEYEPVGCAACNGTGFKGRLGIFEAIVIDEEMDKLLRNAPSEADIQAVQEKRPVMTMVEDGVVKVLNGITSMDELERVVVVK
jgi:type IV pilus assembly protein PilB